MKQLSGHDSVYLYAETPSTPGHLGLLYIYDQSTAEKGTVRFKSILQHIDEHLDISHVFRSRLMRMPLDVDHPYCCLLYTSPSPRDRQKSRMPSSA